VLIFALVLLVVGVGAMGVSLIPASGEAPKYECVTDAPVSSGVTDPARCGQTTEGAYVAVPLTDEQVAAARAYQAPAYRPLDGSGPRYGGRSSSGGKYCPTIFLAYDRAELSGVWISEQTDRQLTSDVLLPWTSGR